MMMSLGLFAFSIDSLAYQELARRTSWRFASSSRVGARPASQFLGPGEDSFSLKGVLLPELAGDVGALNTLREMGDKGDAWPLVDGTGVVHGNFEIHDLSDNRSTFFQDGAARHIDFELQLHRVDDADAPAA